MNKYFGANRKYKELALLDKECEVNRRIKAFLLIKSHQRIMEPNFRNMLSISRRATKKFHI